MAADPDWSDLLQGPANISGMLSMDGNRYQRRVIIQTTPGEQWGVERELRGRFRAGFARSGLEFAVPRFIDVTTDRKSTRLNSSHVAISSAFFRLRKDTL